MFLAMLSLIFVNFKKENFMKKIFLVLFILAVAGGAVFAFDISSFPSPINKGDILLSPTLSLGNFGISGAGDSDSGDFALGATFSFEYALPLPFALTVGAESGIAIDLEGDMDGVAIPILARASWHLNFEVPNLDPYVTLKLGYTIWTTEGADGGFSFGFNAGARYFFSPTMAVFGELGYDRYTLMSESIPYYGDLTLYIFTWFHAGVTFRLGGSGGGSGTAKRTTTSSSGYMLVNADTLNVRKGPSADYDLVGQLARGNRVQILDSSGQWYKVRFGNIEGYVNSSYLTKDNAQG